MSDRRHAHLIVDGCKYLVNLTSGKVSTGPTDHFCRLGNLITCERAADHAGSFALNVAQRLSGRSGPGIIEESENWCGRRWDRSRGRKANRLIRIPDFHTMISKLQVGAYILDGSVAGGQRDNRLSIQRDSQQDHGRENNFFRAAQARSLGRRSQIGHVLLCECRVAIYRTGQLSSRHTIIPSSIINEYFSVIFKPIDQISDLGAVQRFNGLLHGVGFNVYPIITIPPIHSKLRCGCVLDKVTNV